MAFAADQTRHYTDAFVFKHSGFTDFHLLWTFDVELLINISGSFIVVLIFRIIFSVLFQIFLSVLPLVTFVPFFFIHIRPIASGTMLLLRREECYEVVAVSSVLEFWYF